MGGSLNSPSPDRVATGRKSLHAISRQLLPDLDRKTLTRKVIFNRSAGGIKLDEAATLSGA